MAFPQFTPADLVPLPDAFDLPFDLLWIDGEDLGSRPLMDRKRLVREILPEPPWAMLDANYVEPKGVDSLRLAGERDLEGMVAKLNSGAHGEVWFKIRNPEDSQYGGRRELFEKKRAAGA
jgi:ATP-dependent DNA ligase